MAHLAISNWSIQHNSVRSQTQCQIQRLMDLPTTLETADQAPHGTPVPIVGSQPILQFLIRTL